MYGLAQVVFAHAPVHGAFPVRWAAVR
jgi:hypothetical protein